MSRPINYNDWFYKYHKYVKGNRDGLITYNDTKVEKHQRPFVTINEDAVIID